MWEIDILLLFFMKNYFLTIQVLVLVDMIGQIMTQTQILFIRSMFSGSSYKTYTFKE